MAAASSSALGAVGDVIEINFRENTAIDFVPSNPPGFRDIPMITIGGLAHYTQPWEVTTAWNEFATAGNELQSFGGAGTITLDQIPSLPEGEYHVFLNMNIANWNNGSLIGIQLSGQGVTEVGNEIPGAMHLFYPQSNPGAADPISDMQIAGPDMGPNSEYMVDSAGTQLTTVSNGFPLPTGSNPNIFNDGNSFATSLILAPGNQLVLTMQDGAAVGFSHIRGTSMVFSNIAAYVPLPTEACCLSDGTCVELDPNYCIATNGLPQGAGTNCAMVVCEASQACCFYAAGTCADIISSDCVLQGGVPLGDGTSCATPGCPSTDAPITDFSVNDYGALCFLSETGVTYELQYTTNLVTTTGWVNAGATITATETNTYFFDPVEPAGSDTTNKIYRVLPQ
jgi:hypothetical protein